MIYKAAVINFLFLIGIALFYAFCHMTVAVDFKNSVTGFYTISDPPVLLAVSCGLVSGVRTGGSGIVENESAAYRQQDAAGKTGDPGSVSVADASAVESEFRNVSQCEPDQ